MTPIRESVEIARRPEDVFAYLDDYSRHTEWQTNLVSAHVDTEGPIKVGTRVTEVRRMGKREQPVSIEITEHDPPRSFAFRGTEGPIRPVGTGTTSAVSTMPVVTERPCQTLVVAASASLAGGIRLDWRLST